jgi:sugar lactone lactonase YvrE
MTPVVHGAAVDRGRRLDVTTARQVTEVITHHGEGPFWDRAAGRLLVVDMLAGAVVSAVPEVSRYEVGGVAAAIRARVGGGYVLATERGFQLYTADFTPDGPPIAAFHDPKVRMNDGGCDPQGRFYCGTMAYAATPGAGALYRLDPDLTVHEVLTGVTISNGVQWPADGHRVYYNDTPTGRVDRYAFDPAAGTFGARETLAPIDPRRASRTGWPSMPRAGSGWPCGAAARFTGTRATAP